MAKLESWYIFRIIQTEPQIKVQVMKWSEGNDHPDYSYELLPRADECSCPAWTRQCKHVKAWKEAVNMNITDRLWEWEWEPKGGWTHVPPQEMPDFGDLFDD